LRAPLLILGAVQIVAKPVSVREGSDSVYSQHLTGASHTVRFLQKRQFGLHL